MSNYREVNEKKLVGSCYTHALEDFVSSFLKASEIEFVDLEKMIKVMGNVNLPISFLLINATIDKLLESMKERIPDRVPPIKEFKKSELREK